MKLTIVFLAMIGLLSEPALAKNGLAKKQRSTVAELCANAQLAKKKGLDCKATGTSKRETARPKPRLGFEINPWGLTGLY